MSARSKAKKEALMSKRMDMKKKMGKGRQGMMQVTVGGRKPEDVQKGLEAAQEMMPMAEKIMKKRMEAKDGGVKSMGEGKAYKRGYKEKDEGMAKKEPMHFSMKDKKKLASSKLAAKDGGMKYKCGGTKYEDGGGLFDFLKNPNREKAEAGMKKREGIRFMKERDEEKKKKDR